MKLLTAKNGINGELVIPADKSISIAASCLVRSAKELRSSTIF